MKQIFDWLRDGLGDYLEITCDMPRYAVSRAKWLVDEAEAKWEADCKRADFEYRINEVLPMLEEKCLYGTASLIKAMADALGIKISEVE